MTDRHYIPPVGARVRLRTMSDYAALGLPAWDVLLAESVHDIYEQAEASEDRYLGSVFVTPRGAEEYRQKTQAAYEACKALGMGVEHGL